MTRPSSRTPSVHPLLWWSLGGFAAMTLVALTSPLPVILDAYLHDDSFYYLTIAENFAAGRGSTFDGINDTNGYQPVWMVLLAVMFASGVGHDQMVTVGVAVQALLFGLGTVVLSVALARNGVTALAAAAATSVVYFGIAPALGWDLLEAGLNVLTSATVLLAFTRLCGPGISPLSLGLVLAVAGLVRTDHLVFLPIGGVLLAWRIWNDAQPGKIQRLLAFSLPAVALVGSYLASNLLTMGHLMPISGVVKSRWPQSWTLQDNLLALVAIDLRQSWKAGLAVALVLVIRDVRRRRASPLGAYSLGALAMFSYYVMNIYRPGDAFWHHVPLYALLCYGIAVAGQWGIQLVFRNEGRLATVVVAIALTIVLGVRLRTQLQYRDRPDGERADIYHVAMALKGLVGDTGARVAAWDAGILGYYAGPVTNIDGLVNSGDYYDRYLSLGRTTQYIREHRFTFVACYAKHFQPGQLAGELMEDYEPVFRGRQWLILKRTSS
jgi:hypothetical protein